MLKFLRSLKKCCLSDKPAAKRSVDFCDSIPLPSNAREDAIYHREMHLHINRVRQINEVVA